MIDILSYLSLFCHGRIEAWGLMKKHLGRHEEIMQEFGSAGQSPYREDVVSFSLETVNGIWHRMAPIKPKPPSKKRRTFGPIGFMFANGVEGRFARFLPKKEGGAGTLH